MMKLLVTSLIALLAILNFNGCSTHEGATYGESVVDENGYSIYKLNSVAILDKGLQRWEYIDLDSEPSKKSKIAVENLGITSLDTGNVEVFTTVRNRTDYPQQLEIRTQFYDDNKITTEPPSAWKRVHLPQNSSMTYKEKSITIHTVTNFLIEVREGE